MSLINHGPSPASKLSSGSPTPRPRGAGSGRALFLALGLVGLGLVGLALAIADPIVAALCFTLGFVAFTAVGLIGLTGRIRRPFTLWPSTRAGWAASSLLVLGWGMVVITALPWLDPASLDGAGRTMAAMQLIAGYGLLLIGSLVAVAAVWWGSERSRPLVLLAVLHLVWVTYVAVGFLPEIVASRL